MARQIVIRWSKELSEMFALLTALLVCSLLAVCNAFRIEVPKIPILHCKGSLSTPNFEDREVECISEGGTTRLESGSEVNAVASLGPSTLKISQNFQDNGVNCVSESSSVRWSGGNVGSFYIAPPPPEMSKTVDDLQLFLRHSLDVFFSWAFIGSSASDIVKISDKIDELVAAKDYFNPRWLRTKRSLMMADMLSRNRQEYLATASFMANRIPRSELPNVQNVPYPESMWSSSVVGADGQVVLEDCHIPKVVYRESALDKFLLRVFRRLVQKEIGFVSQKQGILGLLEEGRYYKLSEEGRVNDSVNQHRFVKSVLGSLLTPVLPPFYRIFMAGIIPSKEMGDPDWMVSISESLINAVPDSWPIKRDLYAGKQFGPWFYAPALTSVVTPPFMSFLLGPSRVNRRKDGALGGMVVEKCKFLQESNCKGLCLHQCKIPAQEYFKNTLGVDLTVSPNFETQECQWSWGESPRPHTQDPDFPKGCIKGCETRSSIIEAP